MNLLDEIQTNILEQEILTRKSTFFDEKFSSSNLDYACELMRALSNNERIRIVNFIRSKKETVVNKIYNYLQIEQSVASQHLAVLRQAGVIDSKKNGKFVHVSLNEDVLLRAQKAISNFKG